MNKDTGIIPLTDARGITKPYNYPSHKGIDIGWAETPNCPVLAWQDGVVVRRGYGSEVGNYIVVEHYYNEDNTKRWTGYIHLAYFPTVKVGDKVYLGQQMANATRGNTGQSSGVHLHFYLTKCVPQKTPYTWDTMLANVTDPYEYLYYNKRYNTMYISTEWKKELELMKYPEPVERDETRQQVEIKSDTRRLRKTPSLKGKAYAEYCKRGIYNVYDWKTSDGYDWRLIDTIDENEFWVAVMSGEDLPIVDYKELYNMEVLKRQQVEMELSEALSKLKSIKDIIEN